MITKSIKKMKGDIKMMKSSDELNKKRQSN